jgi:CO dehydrogenase/acetyl-CoA synthase gamma subunit (corrinoid Fe-S protein)
MRLPRTSRRYDAEIEELTVGKGDYRIGGARSPAFLDLDDARHRRPVIFGEAFDDLEGYHCSAASMFSGRQNDLDEWAVMWKELGADGVCLRLTGKDSPETVRRIAERTRLPIMVSAETDELIKIAESVDDTVLIIKCESEQQSLEVSKHSNNHVVVARCESMDPKELCRAMNENGAKNITVDLGDGKLDKSLKSLRERMEAYRMEGLNGVEDAQHTLICDVTGTWDMHGDDVSARRASMFEASVALAAMMSGADIVVVRGPGAADMARVYGEELADL